MLSSHSLLFPLPSSSMTRTSVSIRGKSTAFSGVPCEYASLSSERRWKKSLNIHFTPRSRVSSDIAPIARCVLPRPDPPMRRKPLLCGYCFTKSFTYVSASCCDLFLGRNVSGSLISQYLAGILARLYNFTFLRTIPHTPQILIQVYPFSFLVRTEPVPPHSKHPMRLRSGFPKMHSQIFAMERSPLLSTE